MKKYILILLLFSFNIAICQENLNIDKAIEMALSSSDLFKQAKTKLLYSETSNSLFKKTFLPDVFVSSVFPSISKSVTRITTPDGQDIFVNQNQAYYDFSLNIEQKEPLFGGIFTFSSYFNRIDLFGDINNKTYFTTPFSLSYANTNFFFNSYKYERKINELKTQEANVNYNISIEDIVYQTVEKYFDAYIKSENIRENLEVQKSQKEIYNIAKKRFKIGSINKGDLLSLELNILNTESSINDLITEQKNSKNSLSRYIKQNLDSIQLKLPINNIINFDISYDIALGKMLENNILMKTLIRQRIEKELEIKTKKSEEKFSFETSLSLGLSNTGNSFSESINNLQDQQLFSISIKYLLFDFGKNKQTIELLNLEKKSLENDYLIEIEELKDELFSLLIIFKNNQKKISILKKKSEIAKERYMFLKNRFSLGNVTISDLNISQRENREINNESLKTLQNIWLTYYKIRKLTMYDFENDKAINYY
jgi:outer membrane protein TolC